MDGFAWLHVIGISDTAARYISKYIDMNILYMCKYIWAYLFIPSLQGSHKVFTIWKVRHSPNDLQNQAITWTNVDLSNYGPVTFI